MTNKQITGAQGETLAVDYLKAHGYNIIATNWHCPAGEIDIIAQTGEILVFVEVRTRHASVTDDAFASITPRKRQRLIATAHHYMAEYQQDEIMWRVDVIGIALKTKHVPIIEHVEDALGW